jgi:RNA polymerase sigma-70 factor (ECF subfamily)
MTSEPALPAGFDAHPALLNSPPTIAADPDVHLMMLFQDGNDEAFAQLVRRNQHKVFAVIFRFLRNRAEAEDLTQEVFLRVYRTAARYEPTARFSTWLYSIATNISRNAIRSRSRLRTSPLEIRSDDDEGFHRDLPDTTSPQPQTAMDKQEQDKAVMEAIDQLPEQQKVAIILNKYEDLCYEDVAAVLDCSVMAVKSLLSRARSNLKTKLMPYFRK